MKVLLTKKLGMTTLYEEGKAQNVTLLEVGQSVVTGVRTMDRDGYLAVQVSLKKEQSKKSGQADVVKEKSENKKESFIYCKEFRLTKETKFEKGQSLTVDQFMEGEKVVVRSVSKGKGYQGVMKRHGFGGSPSSHGHRHDHRAPGSIGSAFPERVFKGRKMAGRMGHENIKKITKIVLIDKEAGLIALKGGIAGNNGAIVEVYSL